jgi:hypothetical protein
MYVCLIVFETGPHHADQAGLELMIILSQPPRVVGSEAWTTVHARLERLFFI